jgi:hypothetical protein
LYAHILNKEEEEDEEEKKERNRKYRKDKVWKRIKERD